jgi:hypothetical protein
LIITAVLKQSLIKKKMTGLSGFTDCHNLQFSNHEAKNNIFFSGHNPSSLLAIPITFCVLGVVVTVSAVVYAAKVVRKKSHLTEVADFNFHPHIRTRSKLSIIVKNLVSQFTETGEYDSRRHVTRRLTYGSFEDSESSEEDCLLNIFHNFTKDL